MLSHQSFNALIEIKNMSQTYFFATNNNDINDENVFIAIVGARYNPLDHLDKLEQTSIKYILCEKKDYSQSFARESFEFLVVDNLEEMIGRIGEAIADEFQQRGEILAISGSNGKTTTKEMLNSICMQSLGEKKVISTQKNYNNHLGVPFTLFQIRTETKLAIVELGSNAPGEIEFLAKMIKPHYAVTTNIGDTHLEFFGTRNEVLKEESIVSKYTQKNFFLNLDDKLLSSQTYEKSTVSYGQDSQADFTISFEPQQVSINEHVIRNEGIIGEHNFYNLACACIMAHKVLGLSFEKLNQFALKFAPTANRSQLLEWGEKKVFLDAYNSNPSSMRASLSAFELFVHDKAQGKSSCCVIVGDMNELGPKSQEYHREIGEYVCSRGFGRVIFIGQFAHDLAGDNLQNTYIFKNVHDHLQEIKSAIKDYQYLFIKGSRSLQLERITDIK